MEIPTYASGLFSSVLFFSSCAFLFKSSAVVPPLPSALSLGGAPAYCIARNLGILRILGFRRGKKALEGYQGGLDGQDWRPSGGEGVKTDGALSGQLDSILRLSCAYGLTANIGMPYLGDKLHQWRSEGVVGWYPNVDAVLASLIRSVGWALEATLEVRQIIIITSGGQGHLGPGVLSYVLDLL